MTSPVEWHKRQVIEDESNSLELNLKLWSKYDMYHTVKELEVFFDTVVKEHHLTQAQADHAKRARLTFVKIFKYN